MVRRLAAAAVFAGLLVATPARAGGMNEAPEQGAQALARGGAFVAKADDATAILHNVAGLAAQHGTKVLLGANLQSSTFSFRRAGNYARASGDEEGSASWAGRPYPAVENTGDASPLPMLAVVSDLGTERLGVGIGVYGPSANPGKRFSGVVGTAPSPARYDSVSSGSSILVMPTAGAAYAVTDAIRIGVAAHAVVGRFDESNIVYMPTDACGKEDPRCDGHARLMADGVGFAGSIGALVRATDAVHVGLQVRTATSVEAEGQTVVMRPNNTWLTPKPQAASLTLDLPWILRAGVRYVEVDHGFEVYDLELDAIYEGWGASAGPRVVVPELKKDYVSEQGWNDTLGVRAGGAYNLEIGESVLSLRAGAYYDGSSTESGRTRIDFDTLVKVGSTMGLGFRTGSFAFSVAYAATASIPRMVEDGQLQVKDLADKPIGVVNNGEYRGFSHTVAASIEVDLARIFGRSSEVPAADPISTKTPGEDTLGGAWKPTPHAPSRRPRAVSASAR